MTPGRDCRDCGGDISAYAPVHGVGGAMACPGCGCVSVVQRTPSGRLEWRTPRAWEWFGVLMDDPIIQAAIRTVWRERDRRAAGR